MPETIVAEEPQNWGRLPGHLKSRVLQALSEGYPKEYEPLVRAYLKALAKQGRLEVQKTGPASGEKKP